MDFASRNVALVQRAWDAFIAEPITLERVRSGQLQPVLDAFDPDIVWETTPLGLPGMGEYRGHEGVIQFWADWFEVFEHVATDVVAIEGSGDKVITLSRQTATGVASGTEATWEFAMVVTVGDDKIVRADFCADMEEARRIAGFGAEIARNLDIAERGWAAFTAQPITIDFIAGGGIKPVLEMFDRGVVWDVSAVGLPGPAEYYGHRGIRQFWMDWYEAFDEVDNELLLLEAAGDKVISLNRQTGRGIGSGTEATMEVAVVFTMRDGKVVRLQMYTDLADAREAAGLDPNAVEPLELA